MQGPQEAVPYPIISHHLSSMCKVGLPRCSACWTGQGPVFTHLAPNVLLMRSCTNILGKPGPVGA